MSQWTLKSKKPAPLAHETGRRSLGDSRPFTAEELQFERLILAADMVQLVIRDADGLPEPVRGEIADLYDRIDRVIGRIRW